jgi:hypothetical protein
MAAAVVPLPGSEISRVSDVIKPPHCKQAVQIHVWRYQVFGHIGHAAMQVYKNGAVEELISWWPDKAGLGNRRISGDALAEMSEETKKKLDKAEFHARAGQFLHKYGALDQRTKDESVKEYSDLWMQLPEVSIALPGMNNPRHYWGLHLPSIINWWDNWSQHNEYAMYSTTRNCSGAVALALKEAGAECYFSQPFSWLVITPNQIAEWAQKLKDRFGELEQKALTLRTKINVYGDKIWNCPIGNSVLPRLEQWKEVTAIDYKPRSLWLRSIDSALDAYMSIPFGQSFNPKKHSCLINLVEALHGHVASRPDSERRISVLMLAAMTLRHVEAENARLWESPA